jgi:hypothetical protein
LLLFAFIVSHCMFDDASDPPQASGTTWSTSYPGHDPVVRPVEGQGWLRRNAVRAELERFRFVLDDELVGALCFVRDGEAEDALPPPWQW